MKEKEAEEILKRALASMRITLQEHQTLQHAVQVLVDAANKVKMAPVPRLAEEKEG